MKKKIYHVAENFEYKFGGVNKVIRSIHKNINKYDHKVINIKKKIITFKQIKQLFFLRKESAIFHIHGIWNPVFPLIAIYCIFFGKKFVLSVHGNISEVIWKKNGLIIYCLRWIYWYFFASNAFRKASNIHAVEKREFRQIKKYFKNNKITEIYHIYDFAKKKYYKNINNNINKNIIFIGRIDRVKGLDVLINSFGEIKNLKNFNLIIYGPIYDKKHHSFLKDLVNTKKLASRIYFKKPVTGKKMESILRSSWAFANPSRTEVLGLTNFEAANQYLPIIVSNACGIDKLNKNGGISINPNISSLKNAIDKVLRWNLKNRFINGQKINKFFKKKFAKKPVINSWNNFYQVK